MAPTCAESSDSAADAESSRERLSGEASTFSASEADQIGDVAEQSGAAPGAENALSGAFPLGPFSPEAGPSRTRSSHADDSVAAATVSRCVTPK